MEPAQGDQWPEARSNHSACVLNYGEDCPTLLVFGGEGKGSKVLGHMWILDVDSGKWTEVRMLVYNNDLSDFRLGAGNMRCFFFSAVVIITPCMAGVSCVCSLTTLYTVMWEVILESVQFKLVTSQFRLFFLEMVLLGTELATGA